MIRTTNYKPIRNVAIQRNGRSYILPKNTSGPAISMTLFQIARDSASPSDRIRESRIILLGLRYSPPLLDSDILCHPPSPAHILLLRSWSPRCLTLPASLGPSIPLELIRSLGRTFGLGVFIRLTRGILLACDCR